MSEPPLAFIYDRHASPRARAVLDLRLEGCRNWALAQGWEIAGRWVDLGDDALSDAHRPRFDELVTLMRGIPGGRARICLVHHWDRLTRYGDRFAYQRRVAGAGGSTATTFGEGDRVAGVLLGQEAW
ncbi:recombinase family protein [Streptomyces sp. NPDC096310]|uniref:recombinase family protein n=1 Tax=Streptomyces sp. NPDC096310 TaxID=3366082 RepID=UPI00382CEC40